MIRRLRLRTLIGARDWEQDKRQDVIIDVTLHTDTRQAGASDHLDDAVDYKQVKDAIVSYVETAQHQLLEALATAVADLCLKDERVRAVDVVIDKPGALRFADSVAIAIHRP